MADTPARFQITTREPDVAHDWLRKAYADHTVTLSGPSSAFRFSHIVADCGPFKVGVCRHTMTLRGDWSPLEDQMLFSHLVQGRFTISCRRTEIAAGPGDVFTYDPDVGTSVEWSDITMAQVRMDRSAVERVAAELTEDGSVVPVGFDLARPVSPARARRWIRLMQYLSGDVATEGPPPGPLVLREMFRMLVVTAMETFPNTARGPALVQRPHGQVSAAAVRRAVAYIQEHAGEDIDLVSIAEAARVGPRALQRAFRSSLDLTPLEYLRGVRLDRAHDDLRLADPGSTVTVAAVAARWGFGHPGRFAAAYRTAYGRSPSGTLRD